MHEKPTPLARPSALADAPPHDLRTEHEKHVVTDPNHIAQPVGARDGGQ